MEDKWKRNTQHNEGQEKQHDSTGHAGRRTATEQPCNSTGGSGKRIHPVTRISVQLHGHSSVGTFVLKNVQEI